MLLNVPQHRINNKARGGYLPRISNVSYFLSHCVNAERPGPPSMLDKGKHILLLLFSPSAAQILRAGGRVKVGFPLN
jgi:hypothetical protein